MAAKRIPSRTRWRKFPELDNEKELQRHEEARRDWQIMSGHIGN